MRSSESDRGAHAFHPHPDAGFFVRDPQHDAAAVPAPPELARSFSPDVRFVRLLLRLPAPRDLVLLDKFFDFSEMIKDV